MKVIHKNSNTSAKESKSHTVISGNVQHKDHNTSKTSQCVVNRPQNTISEIINIQYGCLSADQWRSFAVCEINKPLAADGGTSEDRNGTPYDSRLGEVLNNTPCGTCGQTNINCTGHFGYINLPFPIYNKEYSVLILKTLQCVCMHCSSVLIDAKKNNSIKSKQGFERLKLVAKLCSNVKQCILCKEATVSYDLAKEKKKESGVIYYSATHKNKTKREELKAGVALNILSNIKYNDLKTLGYNNDLIDSEEYKDNQYFVSDEFKHNHQSTPDSMIWTVFPVIPSIARPWVTSEQEGGERKDDDLTDKYNSILKSINLWHTFGSDGSKYNLSNSINSVNSNNDKKNIPRRSKSKSKKDVEKDICENVWTLIDNTKGNSKLSSGNRPHRSIVCRLKGKDGRVNSNVAGKRVNFSARTVIVGGGIRLNDDELGIPIYIATKLTKQEFVIDRTINYLQKLVSEGKVNCVLRAGKKERLSGLPSGGIHYQLKYGDIVERQLQDGDIVLFNRQPTLRIESMMSFRAKIVPYLTFVVPLWVVSSFNADFDGDEMNLHVPQTIEAELEIMVNARCALHIVSSQNNAPVNGIVQDGLVSSYILTNHFNDGILTTLTRELVLKIYKDSGISDDRVEDLCKRAYKFYPEYIQEKDEQDEFGQIVKKYSFKETVCGTLFMSILFPRYFWYRKFVDHYNPLYKEVKIKDGVLKPYTAPLCKKTIGTKGGSIIQALWKITPETSMRFMSELQQITDRWLPHYGFSMGISDCFASKSKDIARILIESHSKVDSILKNEALTNIEKEKAIIEALNTAMNVGPSLAKDSMMKGDRNALNIMRNSGAKGSVINLAQIVAFLGQQNIKGVRMPQQLSYNTRCLPSFLPGDNSPEARGFVQHNYIQGLTPQEAFFHAAAGREGVISTSVKTPETGYIQKKLARKLEDLKVWVDGTVRDANGCIVNFLYGGDGLDAKKLLMVKGLDIPFFINPIVVAHQLNSEAEQDEEVDITKDKKRELAEEEIELLLSFIELNKIQSPVILLATENTRINLRKTLKYVKIYECKIPDLCAHIKESYGSSKAQYGTAVGLISTSSLGEPTTQMVLDVFHLAGVSQGRGGNLGVPRFKELIGATKSKNQKHKGCIVYFDSETIKKNAQKIRECEEQNKNPHISIDQKEVNLQTIKKSKEESLSFIQHIKKDFEEIFVKDFIEDCEMKYLPNHVDIKNGGCGPVNIVTYEEYKEEWWVTFSKDIGISKPINKPNSWVINIKFDMEKLFRQRVELEDIALAIELNTDGAMSCVISPDVIGRIEVYVAFSDLKKYVESKIELPPYHETKRNKCVTDANINYYICREVAINVIKNTKVTGIRGVTKVYPREDLTTREWLLDTDGANFLDILTMEGVDAYRTIVDDPHSIGSVLGIAAQNKFLKEEITRVISFDGSYINPRHVSLLVDAMTVSGDLTAASRDGISRDVGPNAKIMFEKSVDNAITAAAFGELDNMVSLSSAVMYGKLAKIGPGMVTVMYDDRERREEIMRKNREEEEEYGIQNKNNTNENVYVKPNRTIPIRVKGGRGKNTINYDY